jgi:hypothetical protein
MVWPINEGNLACVRHIMGETKASQFIAGKANVAPGQEKLPRKRFYFTLAYSALAAMSMGISGGCK